jgi:hypothetical protein
MYIPKADFILFEKAFKSIFGTRDATCDSDIGACYWNKRCEVVWSGYTTHNGER